MISFDYAARHLRSVWRLAVGDEDWRAEMDITTDGVFASFWAIALSAPFAVLGIITETNIAKSAPAYQASAYARAPLALILPTELLSSVAAWLLTLAALALAARRLGATRDAAPLIISYNWSQLLAFLTTLAPAIAVTLTGNPQLGAFLFLGVLIFSIYLFWVVLRRNLPIDVGVAIALIAGLTALAFGVYAVITNVALRLYQLMS